MKKITLRVLISAFLFFVIFSDYALAEFKKTKIAVLDFQLQGEGHETADMGKIVAEWLITALVKEGRFDVIERRLLAKVLDEQKFGVSGLADETTVAKLGKLLGAKIVISGSVMKYQNVLEANARIIEVESASIIAAESVKSTSSVRLEDLVVRMAEKIIKDFPLEGYIVQREASKVLIDLGKRTGVKPGMQFIVYKEGKVIKHPKTGEILDIERIETGSIEIKDVKDKTADAAVLKESETGAVKTGQMVKSMLELISEPQKKIIPETTSLTMPASVDLSSSLSSIDRQCEELRQMRESGNPAWKAKFKSIMTSLKMIHARNKTSPEIYLSYAKVYFAVNELGDADKILRKAFQTRPQYIEAFIFRGDMYYEYAKKLDTAKRQSDKFSMTARDAYQSALSSSQDKDLQAMMHFKIGNVYSDLAGDNENAKESWQKAVSTAPGSQAARLANERLKAN